MRLAVGALVLAVLASAPAHAIERIRARIDTMTVGSVTAHAIRAELSIPSTRHSRFDARAAEIELPRGLRSQIGRLTQIHVQCDDPLVREPSIACDALHAEARATKLPPLEVTTSVRADVDAGRLELAGRGPTIADQTATFQFQGTARDWEASAALPSLALTALRELVAPWIALPDRFVPTGSAAMSLAATATAGEPEAHVTAALRSIDYSNPEATLVAEKVDGDLEMTLGVAPDKPIAFKLVSGAGQVLAGPVFVDLAKHPATLTGQALRGEGELALSQIALQQRGLLTASGDAVLGLEPFAVRSAEIDLRDLRFPDAWASLLQIPLATTRFAQLATAGTAHAHVRMAAGKPVGLDLTLERFNVTDPVQKLEVHGIDGELHWTDGSTVGPPQPSALSWQDLRVAGLTSSRSRIDFALQDRDFRLLKPARLPVFDGALVINQLDALGIGTEKLAGDFDARIEPISLEQITRMLGWTEFGGRVSGRIPGLSYRDKVLTLQGDLEAELFDGRLVARNLSIRDPLGATPQLRGDFSARNFDLEQLTRTFSFGSITGRLDGDMTGVETSGWTPVAFDLTLATPAGDKSRHRISQKAVKKLSSIGGGGNGVAAALQSGALRFFDTFRYDRMGLSCRLAEGVCAMNGVEPARNGYYIVKGSGLPRIDIIGNQTRVDWPLLVSQVKTALENSDDVVVD